MGFQPDLCASMEANTTDLNLARASECWTETWIASMLRQTLPLIILPISLVCNFLSFIALRSRHMRGTSTAFFMLALSVLDPLLLVTKNLLYFSKFVAAHSFSCRLIYFLIYVLNYTNVWILVIMTADKFFAVWFPLKVSYFCTITRARYACVCLLIITSMISFHHFWTIDSLGNPQDQKQRFCFYLKHDGPIQRIWRYADFVIWCFLPFILILTLSVLIIYRLRQKRQIAHPNIRHVTVNKGSNGGIHFPAKTSRQQKAAYQTVEVRSNQKTEVIRSRHRHITLMLLAVAVVFLLLTLPNSIYFVLEVTYSFSAQPTGNDYHQWVRYRRLTILTVIMFQLSDLQHATNFFLYVLTSDKFRRTILGLFSTTGTFISSLLVCSPKKQRDSSTSLQNHLALEQTQRGRLPSFRSSASDVSPIPNQQRFCTAQPPSKIRSCYPSRGKHSATPVTSTAD